MVGTTPTWQGSRGLLRSGCVGRVTALRGGLVAITSSPQPGQMNGTAFIFLLLQSVHKKVNVAFAIVGVLDCPA